MVSIKSCLQTVFTRRPFSSDVSVWGSNAGIMFYCCVPGCKSYKWSFHWFQFNQQMKRQWIVTIQRDIRIYFKDPLFWNQSFSSKLLFSTSHCPFNLYFIFYIFNVFFFKDPLHTCIRAYIKIPCVWHGFCRKIIITTLKSLRWHLLLLRH